MTLAEALAARKDLLTEINSLSERAAANVLRYEDEELAEAEQAPSLLTQMAAKLEEFEALGVAINNTNNVVRVNFDGDSLTMMEAVARRERMSLFIKRNRSVLEALEGDRRGRRSYGYEKRSKDDVRQVSTMETAALRNLIDGESARMRALDVEMQKVNWSTDLI